MDDATTDEIMKEMTDLAIKTDKLIANYDKMRKGPGVKPAAQFAQMESYLLSVVWAKFMETIHLLVRLTRNISRIKVLRPILLIALKPALELP